MSPAYVGRISDKNLTNDCGYLDMIPPYTTLMVNKGFMIEPECTARRITLYVPPGKRGMSHMGSSAKVNIIATIIRIAKMRILVEQVIRRIKTFRILNTELPISLIPIIDDILVICAAVSNMKKSIYKD